MIVLICPSSFLVWMGSVPTGAGGSEAGAFPALSKLGLLLRGSEPLRKRAACMLRGTHLSLCRSAQTEAVLLLPWLAGAEVPQYSLLGT